MNTFARSSWSGNFSHIYIEEGAEAYPQTKNILKRFRRAKIVSIKDYKEIFSRPRQHFQTQKRSMKLILAVKKERFLYEGSVQSQSFGFNNFYYNTLILNCIYNCDYCYLQGMYPSANIVVFVNIEDFFEATQKAIYNRLKNEEPLYLCVSYDTDLLAFEPIVPYCAKWIEFARRRKDLLIEIRTKSVLYKSIRHLPSTPQVILAWTLSPVGVVDLYEKDTPSLQKRIHTIEEAIGDGWRVRLCFDPVLAVEGWRGKYNECIERVFERLPPEGICDVSVGVFRMNTTYFKRIKKQRSDTDILYHPYEIQSNMVSYSESQRQVIVTYIYDKLRQYLPKEKIAVWM